MRRPRAWSRRRASRPAGHYPDIAEWTGLTGWQVGRRLGELERAGLIRKTKLTFPTPSGRQARVYAAVE